MMRKQILGALLTAVMMGSLLTGCGQTKTDNSKDDTQSSSVVSSVQEGTQDASTESTEQTPEDTGRISEETITLTVAGLYSGGTKDWNSTLQFAEYEKRFGLKFDATVYDSEQWSSKLTLMLASDTMPDIISYAKMTAMDIEQYGSEGYFLDFSQYLDIMPNLSKIIEDYPDYAAAIKSENGAIYAFPVLNAQTDATLMYPIFFNKGWCDNLGLDIPTTLDELYDVLVAFRDEDANGNGDPNDEIPLGLANGRYGADYPILWAHGIYNRGSAFHRMVDENGKVILGDLTENYKDFLRYMKKLYDEGLINEDAFVATGAEMDTKFAENRVGQFTSWATIPGTLVEDWVWLSGYTTEEYSPNPVVVLDNIVGTTYNLAANANTEYPEEIAQFVDFLFSDEGYLSSYFGFEGVTFDYEVTNGVPIVSQTKQAEAMGLLAGEYRPTIAVAPNAFELYRSSTGTVYDLISKTETESLLDEDSVTSEDPVVLAEVALRQENVVTTRIFPSVKYTAEELEERSILYTDIFNYLKAAKIQFIIGEMDIDASWDAHVAKLNEMGLERLLEIEQAAYDRYISK